MSLAIVAAVVTVAAMLVGTGFAAAKPDTLQIRRAVDIDAASERIFPFIDDLRGRPEWPTDAGQAQAHRSFGPISRGKGATSDWAGSGSAAAGRMEITESTPPPRVVVSVDFQNPFAAHNINEFTLDPLGRGTHATWSWRGQNVFALRS